MYRPPRLRVMEVNPYLTCVLCGGYFVDATTIIECLHSFCKTCIVRYLESSKFCPICDVQVHKTRPLMNIRADKTLQDIVYKLVPGLFRNEMKRRRDFFETNPEAAAYVTCQEDRGELTEQRVIYSPDDTISLSLEYGYGKNQLPTNGHSATTTDSGDYTDSKRRFLCCPAAVTVAHLKKFITMKYGLTQSYMVDLMYYDDSLRDDYKLMDIAYIYTWKRNGPMRLFYRILDKPHKRLKTCHPTLTETPTVSTDDKVKSFTPQIPNRMPSGIETNGVESSCTEEKEDTFIEIQSGSQKKKTNQESNQDNLKSLCGEPFKESRPVPSNSTSDNSQLNGTQQVITIEKKKKDYKSQSSNVFYLPKIKTKQDNSFKDKSTTTETHRDLWNSLLKETPRIVEKLKLKPVELPQKSEEQTQLIEAKKCTSQIESKKRTNITETKKTVSSFESKNLNGSSEPKTLANPVESMKPNNPVGPKKSGISVESKTPNIFTGTSLADRKKHIIPADTMKPISRDESKKSTISDESKKFPSPDESKELSSPVECDKLSSPDESKELSSSNKPKKISSPDESKKLTNPDESKELTSADEYKQLTKSNEYNILCSPNESKKLTNSGESKKLINSAESKKPSSSAEPKKFTSLIESKKLTSPSESKKLTSSAESKKVASPAETTKLINLAETKKLASLQEVRKNSNLTETKKLITPSEVNNSTNPIEIKKLSSEPPTIKTTEVNATHLAPTVSSSFSSLVSTTEAPKNQDLTSEVFPAVLGEKAGRHLTTSLQKVPKFSFNEDSKVSWHHEIIEKKSRKDSELKISNSPEFLITKPREIPPIKISRKLSIKIVDHDRLELKEDSEVDSGVGSDVSSRPETQLSVEDDLWSPTNSTPEIEKPATPSKPSLTPPPTPSPSTSNPCPSPNAGYPLCPTPLHVPSISPKLCLSPREENEPQRDDIGALDLSLSHRHEIRHRDRSSQPRSRHVANPPVLDKHRQLICLPAPTTPQLKRPPPPPVPHTHMYNRKGDSGRNHRFKGSTLTVINPDPNSYHPKLVIKNLDPRPDHSHHHHNHRM